MAANSTRRFIRVHLSTAIILTFVAGAIIWTNVRERRLETFGYAESLTNKPSYRVTEKEYLLGAGDTNAYDIWYGKRDYHYGFPFAAMYSSAPISIEKDGSLQYIDNNATPERPCNSKADHKWFIHGIILNGLVALGVLLSVCILCEWWIKRTG